MKQKLRGALAGTAVAVAAWATWAAEPNVQAAPDSATTRATQVRGPITPEMVRPVAGPPRPDNGQVEVQPGLPDKKCSKEDKHEDADKRGRSDKPEKPEKTGRRKGHC